MKFYEHPLNREISQFICFIHDKVDARQMTRAEREVVVGHGNQVFAAAGLPKGPEADDVTVAVFRQQLHVMKIKLLELHPELADEVRNLSGHRQR